MDTNMAHMYNKERYDHLCLTEESIPLFSRDWFLDAVCLPHCWDVLLIEEKGKVALACPLFLRDSQTVSMPPYTQSMGPWFAPASADTKYTSDLSSKQQLATQLVEQLRPYTYFFQHFSHHVTDWLPFYWAGYTQTTRYTYLLPDISDPAALWENMTVHQRRNITKAQNKHGITVRRGIPLADFIQAQTETFERQGMRNPSDQAALIRLIHASQARGQGDLWGGYDSQGRLHAAVFVAWQPSCAYYLAGGGCPEHRHSGAHALVLWQVIQEMSTQSRSFDFEGSMLPGVERFFREFGAEQRPYFSISRQPRCFLRRFLHKVKLKLAQLWRKTHTFFQPKP